MKTRRIWLPVVVAAGAVMAWEWGNRWWEARKAEKGASYWQVYYDADTLAWGEQVRQVHTIRSTGVTLHIDVYPQAASDAPVLIFNHGAAGYCRVFVNLARQFHQLGYTVVLPDQRGQGLSNGRRGDYTIAECVQNIIDVAFWAKARCQGKVYMAGGSVGGALTYYAAAAGAPVDAIACLNLLDFGNAYDGFQISRLAAIAKQPGIAQVLATSMLWLRPFYWLRIPFNWLGAFDKLMDERDAHFQAQWDADPIPPRLVSLRSLASNLNTPPAIPLEQNQIPTLVINQSLDRMVDVSITRHNFERLGGEKRYLEIPFGHWSSQPEFWQTIVQECHEWFGKRGQRS